MPGINWWLRNFPLPQLSVFYILDPSGKHLHTFSKSVCSLSGCTYIYLVRYFLKSLLRLAAFLKGEFGTNHEQQIVMGHILTSISYKYLCVVSLICDSPSGHLFMKGGEI